MTKKSQSSGHQKTSNDEGESTGKIKQWSKYVKPLWSLLVKVFKVCKGNSEPIRNWLIVVFTGLLALYTYRLFDSSIRQTEISEKIEAASIDIMQSSVKQTVNLRFSEIIVTTEIMNTSQKIFAENVEIQSRFDLLEKDFSKNKIVYIKPFKKFPLISGFTDVKLRDTLDVSKELVHKVGCSLWPFLHMRIKYDNGFGERVVINFGFSYDIHNTDESVICKHTYKE